MDVSCSWRGKQKEESCVLSFFSDLNNSSPPPVTVRFNRKNLPLIRPTRSIRPLRSFRSLTVVSILAAIVQTHPQIHSSRSTVYNESTCSARSTIPFLVDSGNKYLAQSSISFVPYFGLGGGYTAVTRIVRDSKNWTRKRSSSGHRNDRVPGSASFIACSMTSRSSCVTAFEVDGI